MKIRCDIWIGVLKFIFLIKIKELRILNLRLKIENFCKLMNDDEDSKIKDSRLGKQ